MAARPRSKARKDWPAGLDEPRPGYFTWKNPITGTKHAIGRVDLTEAKLQALEALLHVKGQADESRLVDRIRGDELTLGQWLGTWLDRLEADGDLAANTVRSYRSLARAVIAEKGSTPLRRTSVEVVADALDAIAEKRGKRTAQAARSMLKTAFTAAMAKGKMDANPALATGGVKVTVQRQRFTWQTFSRVWIDLQGAEPWLRNVVALALVSGQRREDVGGENGARFAAFDDECWRLEQGKTGRKLAIPLDLRLDVFGMSLRDVLAECRRTRVVSKYLIHHTRTFGNAPKGAPVFIDRITKRFSEAVERALGPGENLPTFHELRSLAKRLYEAQGNVDTKALLGHSTERMGELYRDARGAEFERVRVGLMGHR